MKILDFGSLNIDYVFHVEHVVIPGQTICSDKMESNYGGKGFNQAIALGRAGAEVSFACAVGGKDAETVKEILRSSGADHSLLDANHSFSGSAMIQVERGGQNSIVVYGGANQEISEPYVDRVLEKFSEGDILLLQNEISEIPYIMKNAHRKGLKIFLNPSPVSRELFQYPLQYVDTLILNEVEGAQISGEKELEKIPGALLRVFPHIKVVLTLGRKGVVFADQNRTFRNGIFEVPVVDTTAAGDTFTGYYLASVLKDGDIPKALRIASAASSIAVNRQGASPSIPFRREVDDFLKKICV